MKLLVLAIGKLREAWVRAGADEYLRRLRGRPTVEEIEVKRSGELARRLPERGRVWALDSRGVQLTSEELAQRLKAHMDRGEQGITFLIGDADGLPEDLLKRADFRWSLGTLTLPHRLARLVVLEQLYRALSILRGEPYHRG